MRHIMDRKLIILLLIVFLFLFSGCATKLKFDEGLWKISDQCKEDNPRQYMLEDLKSNFLKTGITKKYSIELLGQGKGEPNSISYIIGDDGVDCTLFELVFEDDKLKLTRTVQG